MLITTSVFAGRFSSPYAPPTNWIKLGRRVGVNSTLGRPRRRTSQLSVERFAKPRVIFGAHSIVRKCQIIFWKKYFSASNGHLLNESYRLTHSLRRLDRFIATNNFYCDLILPSLPKRVRVYHYKSQTY
jgi:hypothetical protein